MKNKEYVIKWERERERDMVKIRDRYEFIFTYFLHQYQ